MAQFSTKHKGREQTFFMRTFSDGLCLETSPVNLPPTALTQCKNMRYILDKSPDGQNIVALTTRQGTERLSTTALTEAMKACFYYIAGAQYIVADSTKIWYLNSGVPTELATLSGTTVPTFTEFKGLLIVHDGGVTRSWNGTTLATLGGLHNDEIIGTGENFGTIVYTGTLKNPPLTASSLTITYTDSTGKTITDDGAGALTGDIAADTNTINYTTGAFAFKCSGSPDNMTSIYATYTTTAGAPKSKAGFVRASRLYMWGDSDNPSRLWYSAPNDQDSWDGYLDVDPLDGGEIIGCLNYFQSIVVIKTSKIYRVDNFPGDTTFAVKPLMDSTGSIAYRTCLSDGNVLSFLSKEGWMGLSSTDQYGDITKGNDISAKFRANAVRYATANCYSEYNQIDRQLWLTLYDSTTQLSEIYVVSLDTGGQLSLYEFAFGHTCYKFVNGEMLIGGSDGHLYRLYNENARFLDNEVSYSAKTFIRGVMTDFGAGFNRKHNKRIFPHLFGKSSVTATLNLYTDGDYTNVLNTTSIDLAGGDELIWTDRTSYIFGDTGVIGADVAIDENKPIPKKFNYKQVQFELTDITGSLGAEFYGLDFTGAVLGP